MQNTSQPVSNRSANSTWLKSWRAHVSATSTTSEKQLASFGLLVQPPSLKYSLESLCRNTRLIVRSSPFPLLLAFRAAMVSSSMLFNFVLKDKTTAIAASFASGVTTLPDCSSHQSKLSDFPTIHRSFGLLWPILSSAKTGPIISSALTAKYVESLTRLDEHEFRRGLRLAT